MDLEHNRKRFHAYAQELEHIRALSSLLSWDDDMALPEQGVAFRDETRSYLENKRLDLVKSLPYTQVLEVLSAHIEDLNAVEKAMLREALKDKKLAECLPQEELVAYETLKATAMRVWKEAHNASDYALFKPYLEQIIAFNRAFSKALSTEGHILDPLMDIMDPGATVKETDRVFKGLREGLVALLQQIRQSGKTIADDCLTFDYDEAALATFSQGLVEALGYDPTAGGYAKALHPYTTSLGPKDSRITTNYGSFTGGLFALIHEAGHGMYGQGGLEDLAGTGLWGGIGGALHESQSRLYENIIGRSHDFWTFYYPKLQEALPHFKNLTLERYYEAINRVHPSMIRVQADEVTYSLHVMIRYELEKQLLEGTLSADDLPKAWNDAYEAYLGIRPQNDREGVLQDIHWSIGLFGYFQSYTLGNLYSAQFYQAAERAMPNLPELLKAGEFKPLREWLRENIHQHSAVMTPEALVLAVTGKPLEAEPYLDYLDQKFLKIYR